MFKVNANNLIKEQFSRLARVFFLYLSYEHLTLFTFQTSLRRKGYSIDFRHDRLRCCQSLHLLVRRRGGHIRKHECAVRGC